MRQKQFNTGPAGPTLFIVMAVLIVALVAMFLLLRPRPAGDHPVQNSPITPAQPSN